MKTKPTKLKPRKIVSVTILAEWSDSPKSVVLENDMPNGLSNDFDDWLTDIENEENQRWPTIK